MLETVKRISNISKCRDLINFELLLYRAVCFFSMVELLSNRYYIKIILINLKKKIMIGFVRIGGLAIGQC